MREKPNSSEMLDFEMIKTFTLWQNGFVSFLHGDWAVAWNIQHLPPVALLQGRSPVQDSPVIFTFFFFMILVTSDFGQ